MTTTTTHTDWQEDVWAWTTSKKLTLDEMMALKSTILTQPQARRRLDSHLAGLDESKEARVAGLSRWLLAQYHRAWPLLQKESDTDPVVRFAKATCCLKGQVTEKEGDYPCRRPALAAKLIAGHPDLLNDARVYAVLVDAQIFENNAEEIEASLKRAPSVYKGTAHGIYAQGKVHELNGNYREAKTSYLQALEKDPGHRGALLALAYQHDLCGNDEEAIEYYRRLQSLRPLDLHATLNYGVLLEDMGRYEEAVRCYKTVLTAFPNHSRARTYYKDARASLDMTFDEDIERRHDKRNAMMRVPISDFELSVRARNCLARMNIESLGDLVTRTESELLAYKNFGETSLSEIKVLLEARGLRLGMDLNEEPIPVFPAEEVLETPEHAPIELPEGVDRGILNTVLADLDLSVRCRKALALVRATTVSDLLQHSEAELLALKNFGQTSLSELKARLSEFGVNLRPS
jgi:DNA-directed RNA polymerase subunit alpha